MRGFTMLLVLISHIHVFCYGDPRFDSYNYIFLKVRMPLFFFISGWVLNNLKNDSFISLLHFIIKKFRVQIISTSIFFIIYIYIFDYTLVDSLLDYQKYGYWFTFVLFIYFCFYGISKSLSFIIKNENISFIAICSIVMVIYFYTQYDISHYQSDLPYKNLYGFLSIKQWRFYVFFVMGLFCKKYINQFHLYTNNSIFMALVVCIFFIFILADKHFLYLYRFIIEGATGVFIVYSFFRNNEIIFRKTNVFGKVLQLIGRRTLDIYLLHYFFLPRNLHMFGDYFRNNVNPSLEIVFSLGVSILVIAICLIVSQILRLSDFLSYIAFGGKLESSKR